jgi:glycine cleavage system aminomethyltransferase T
VFVRVDDPDPILIGGEPVFRDGDSVHHLTSASYGYTIGNPAGLGYVDSQANGDGPIAVEVAGRLEAAVLSTTPFYDP